MVFVKTYKKYYKSEKFLTRTVKECIVQIRKISYAIKTRNKKQEGIT